MITPYPLPEVDVISRMPEIRASIASNFEVTAISIERAECPGIWKLTDNSGSSLEGESRIGNSGTSAIPTNARQKKATMIVNGDMLGL